MLYGGDGGGVWIVEGRQITVADIELVERVAERLWGEGLHAIASELCRLWCWRVAGGEYAVQQCKIVLNLLHSQKATDLPVTPRRPRNKRRSGPDEAPDMDMSSIEGRVDDFGIVKLALVFEGESYELWRHLMWKYHYLGERRIIGEGLRYLLYLDGRLIGAMLWGGAALKLASRDRLLGWSGISRKAGLERIASNYRFLILPWVRVKNLASRVLGLASRQISRDWEECFGHGIDLLETFVDPLRFEGTSYLAANWTCVGLTHGSGRQGASYHYHGHRKMIFLYGLSRKMKRRLARSPPMDVVSIRASIRYPRARGFSRLRPNGQLCFGGDVKMKNFELPPSARPPGRALTEDDLTSIAPEFAAYMERFSDVFSVISLWSHAKSYIRGLSQKIKRKSVEPLALLGGADIPVRTLQHFLTGACWLARSVIVRHQQLVSENLGDANGVLIIDGSGIAKKGKESAGVGRQYCGSVGKLENCQVGVYLAYLSPQGATLIDGRLYMQKDWFSEEQQEARWEKCHIPKTHEFKTKPEIGLDMILDVTALGQLPAKWVLADEEYGQNPTFLDGIPNHLSYFCEIPTSTHVWESRPKTKEHILKKGPNKGSSQLRLVDGECTSQTVRDLVAGANITWERVKIKEGTKGPIEADVAMIRVVNVRNSLPGHDVWLFLRRNVSTHEIKYFLSNASENTSLDTLVWLCGMRWPIETCFREAKDDFGMDHYEVRSWTGWHRHMALVMLAHHFAMIFRNLLQKKTPL